MPVPESVLTARFADLDLVDDRGTWPGGIHGEMFISAPVADPRLSYHLFGFGAMLRLSLSPGTHGAPPDRWALRHAVLDTPVRRLHDHAPGLFTGGTMGLDSPFGHANMVNTAPLAWGDRLFATWDVGRPAEVDPLMLSFLGEAGSAASWGTAAPGAARPLPMVFSTAHPVVDHERGCLWTVRLDLSAEGFDTTVVRWGGSGSDMRTWRLPGARVSGSMHTVAQTRNWLVLADSGNFKADMNEVFGGERTATIDCTVPVYFVHKDRLESAPVDGEVPVHRAVFGPTTGHYYAQWDDDDGIRVLFEHLDLTDLGYRLRTDDVDATGAPLNPRHAGFYNMGMAPQTLSEMTFIPGDDRGRITATACFDWSWNLQLSAMDWSPAGMASPVHHHVLYQGRRPGMLAARVLARYGDRVADNVRDPEQRASLATFARDGLGLVGRWEFPSEGDLPSSPIFVPRRDGEPGGADGWVVVPVLNDDGFRIDCFDAADPSPGPVASLRGPRRETMPFLLHSVWMPRAVPAPDVERLSFADDLDPASLGRLSPEARGALEAVVHSFGGGA